MASEHIEHKLALLPDLPGSYQMKDVNGKIIYVGKAKNLKNRVRSYFKSSHDGKTAQLVSNIADFDYIVTSSDKEAFLLEITLIQKWQPYYNIKLKKGTGYPYIKITNERDPKMEITGDIKKTMLITLAHILMSMPRKKPCTFCKKCIHFGAATVIKVDRVCIITWANASALAGEKFHKLNTMRKSLRSKAF